MSTIIDLADYFWEKGKTYSREEIATLMAGAGTRFQGLALAATNPGIPAFNEWYLAKPGVTYLNFKDSTNTAITINSSISGNPVIFAYLSVVGAVSTKVEIAASASGFLSFTDLSYSPGKNLYDKTKGTSNFALQTSTAATVAYPTGEISDFIPVTPLTNYVISGRLASTGLLKPIAFYDSSKALIGSKLDIFNGAFTTPLGAAFCNFTIKADGAQNSNAVQLELGTVASSYEAYTQFINAVGGLPLVDQSSRDRLDGMVTYAPGRNLFNPANVVTGKAYQYQTGELVTYASGIVSGYIPVIARKNYYLSGRANQPIVKGFAWYDSSLNFISTINMDNRGAEIGLLAPFGAAYINFTVAGDGYQDFSLVQFEQSKTKSPFEPYSLFATKVFGKPIEDLKAREYLQGDNAPVKLYAFGDSQTYGVGATEALIGSWPAILANKKGWLTLSNFGHPGQNTSQFIAGSTYSSERYDSVIPDYVGLTTEARLCLNYCTNDVNTISAATFEANLKLLWEHILFTKNWPANKCFCLAGYYVNNSGVNQTTYDTFAAINMRVALSYGVEAYNMKPYVIANGGDANLKEDNIHYNDLGQNLLAATMYKLLK